PLSPGEPLNEYQLQEWQARRMAAAKACANAPTRRNLLDKPLRFTGPRQFKHSLFGGWQLTEPQPTLSVPLHWEYAFGGNSVVRNPEHPLQPDSPEYLLNEVCYSNPLGCGWIEKRQEALGFKLDAPLRERPAPQIEAPDSPVLHLDRAKHPEGGGWHEPKPSALGNKGANSAIGGSWGQKGRVKLLEDAANKAVARGDGSDIMNVELTICPPGKKGK
ncbi:DUF2169 domain-containing protein, partial [Pseudomonas sp. NPDC096917]|uniref:DUF2169 domain-containing protein n=1 Tax=Pseudomonas sp. NPDC096917 TaxID=3364483 RepID=UPI00383B2981